MNKINTANKFMVGVQGKNIVVGMPPRVPISPDDAMLFAAYLVSMAEMDTETKFEDVLEAIQNC